VVQSVILITQGGQILESKSRTTPGKQTNKQKCVLLSEK
jgi:hypothetical protein